MVHYSSMKRSRMLKDEARLVRLSVGIKAYVSKARKLGLHSHAGLYLVFQSGGESVAWAYSDYSVHSCRVCFFARCKIGLYNDLA